MFKNCLKIFCVSLLGFLLFFQNTQAVQKQCCYYNYQDQYGNKTEDCSLKADISCGSIWVTKPGSGQSDTGDQHFQITGEDVLCLGRDFCAVKFSTSKIKWLGLESTVSFGEREAKLQISAVHDSGDNLVLTCVNCDENLTKQEKPENGKMILTLDVNKFLGNDLSLPRVAVYDIRALSENGDFSVTKARITINKVECSNYNNDECETRNSSVCFLLDGACQSKMDSNLCSKFDGVKELCERMKVGEIKTCTYNDNQQKCLNPFQSGIAEQYGVPKGYEGPLPDCTFDGSCDNVNDLLQLLINAGSKAALPIIGGFAFIMFVYGGFMMVTSFGSAERVKKGQQILVAAVIGMIITVSAYLVVSFMLNILEVKDTFRGIK